MVSAPKQKSKRKVSKVKAVSLKSPAFLSSLDALKEVVAVVVEGKTPSTQLLDQIRFYIENLQTSADMVNLVLFQHGMQKHREIMEGIGVLHKELLDPVKLKKRVEDDWEFGLNMLKVLYKEAGMSTELMESKSTILFDAEGLKKSSILAEGGGQLEAHRASKLSSASREKLRNTISKLLHDRTRDSGG